VAHLGEFEEDLPKMGPGSTAFVNAGRLHADAPFGGEPTRGFDTSSESLEALERPFQGGEAELELAASYASGDLTVLVAIERQHGRVGGLPDQDLSLRVTWVFRREGYEWRQVHRHADPLVYGISLERLAALARG